MFPGARRVGRDHARGEQDARGDALRAPPAQCHACKQVMVVKGQKVALVSI